MALSFAFIVVHAVNVDYPFVVIALLPRNGHVPVCIARQTTHVDVALAVDPVKDVTLL